MGREIRRVIANWEHPQKDVWRNLRKEREYQPMRDEPFAAAMDEWYANWKAWCAGTHEDFAEHGTECPNYWEWSGGPPDPEYYRPAWKPEDMTWWQMYETVSEGTPVTPAFASPEQLVDYLCKHGTFWDETPWKRSNAEAFVKSGWAPSMMVSDGAIYTAENMAEMP